VIGDNRVVTAAHVVEGASIVVVATASGQRINSRPLAESVDLDTAVLKVQGLDRAPLRLSDGRAHVGDEVFAIGNPVNMNFSVSRGIISSIRGHADSTFLQTDAAINPGNSGGPLMNPKGQVVGMVTSKVSEAEGLGLALSAGDIADFLRRRPRAPRATEASRTDQSHTSDETFGTAPWRFITLLIPIGILYVLFRNRPKRLRVRLHGANTNSRKGR
jgi:S1-C subfamily serine protease